ncbi:MAG: gliding motility-associated C-terminal domain-containing protein, partial [Bacteroidales bacterium]|nr:gliding motility-associated C-terminal domain-containing protein [Bacteroidales bacterium]
VLGTPCRPTLRLQDSSCDPLMNTLAWSFEVGAAGGAADSAAWADCYTDAAYYKLYYKRYSEPVYEEVATTEETRYEHEPEGYWACYYVTAVNEAGLESEPSETVYADNRSCFTYRLPNVFTPNGDGYNATFRALPNQYVEGFRIDIYNRWGNPVFSSGDPKFEWNGRMGGDGKDCPDGVYFYVVEFTVEAEGLNDKIYQSGSVTILR